MRRLILPSCLQCANMAHELQRHRNGLPVYMPDSHPHWSPEQYIQRPNAPLFFADVSMHTKFIDNVAPRAFEFLLSSVTVAADSQVRVLDVGEGIGLSEKEVEYSSQAACVRVLRCHSDRVKRIVTEESPDLFLTVSEVCGSDSDKLVSLSLITRQDGCVRQHDLRSPHACSSECPSPVVKLAHELSTLALSPLTPYQFVVAGDSPFVC